MQLGWYICHESLGLNTRLVQTRPPKYSKDKKTVELIEIKVDKSSIPVTAIIKEDLISQKVIMVKIEMQTLPHPIELRK